MAKRKGHFHHSDSGKVNPAARPAILGNGWPLLNALWERGPSSSAALSLERKHLLLVAFRNCKLNTGSEGGSALTLPSPHSEASGSWACRSLLCPQGAWAQVPASRPSNDQMEMRTEGGQETKSTLEAPRPGVCRQGPPGLVRGQSPGRQGWRLGTGGHCLDLSVCRFLLGGAGGVHNQGFKEAWPLTERGEVSSIARSLHQSLLPAWTSSGQVGMGRPPEGRGQQTWMNDRAGGSCYQCPQGAQFYAGPHTPHPCQPQPGCKEGCPPLVSLPS